MSKAALLDAIRRLHLEEAQKILDARPALSSAIDRQGRNLLHVASSDIKARDGITPRDRASRKRDKRFAAAMD